MNSRRTYLISFELTLLEHVNAFLQFTQGSLFFRLALLVLQLQLLEFPFIRLVFATKSFDQRSRDASEHYSRHQIDEFLVMAVLMLTEGQQGSAFETVHQVARRLPNRFVHAQFFSTEKTDVISSWR